MAVIRDFKILIAAAFVAIIGATVAIAAPARSEGICNSSANCISDSQGIDSNKTSGGSTLACTYTPVTTGTQNVAYTGATPSASGGVPAYTFSETGSLPTGLTINTSTGVISGTPSVSGTFTGIQVKVADTVPTTVNCGASFTLVISAAPASYSNIGGTTDAGTGSGTVTFSANIGTASAGRVVLIATARQNSGGYTTVTVGGVGCSAVLSHTTDSISQFWTCIGASPGSGSQSIVLTGGIFENRAAEAWVLNNLSSTAPKQTANTATTASSLTISATAGDFLFGNTQTTNSGTFNSSTEAPAANYNNIAGDQLAADWTVISTNAAFLVNSGIFGSLIAVTFH